MAQVMEFFPKQEFRACVARYGGNYRVRNFSCLDQFLCMAFAQLTGRESLRDIETCLRAVGPKLYHAGLRGSVARNTLAKANERRDWRIYRDLGLTLIKKARSLYAGDAFARNLKRTVYAIDSSVVDLCLTLFPWAQHRRNKSAVKLHTQFDLRSHIPVFVHVTGGQTHDLHFLDQLVFETGAFYVMDRAYTDFGRLYQIHDSRAYFVIRARKNLVFTRRQSNRVVPGTGVKSDQIIALTGPKTATLYPGTLRRVHFVDSETGKRFIFLTNNTHLAASTIAFLYRCRWQIELFFKWIKQHLRIKSFFGTSPNAVKTQIWVAISIYVLVAIMKRELEIDRSLYEILQILSVTLFEKVSLQQLLTELPVQPNEADSCNQLRLFDF